MSENNTIRLHEIKMPALNSVGYADGLYSAFTAIEENQSILANSDLWKGDRGDSVDIEKIDLTEHTELFDALKTAIKNGTEPAVINGVSWDGLLNENPYIYVINKTEVVNGQEVKTPMSSLYYTFVDGRFVNNAVGGLTAEDFGNEVDLSCIVVYEEGVFKRLNNIFPTMYFENGYGLCWMVNGQRTGLPVQGIPGKDGRNSDILIVKVKDNAVDENGKGVVEESWSKMGGWSVIDDKASIDGYSCFALAPNEDGATAFYVGKLIFEEDVLYVICKPELSLQQTFDTQVFVNAMQNISIIPNPDMITTPSGLFIPMKALGELKPIENSNTLENQPIHLISATSINNEYGTGEPRTDMIVTPVNTVDAVSDEKHTIKVDKYLYVKMSDELTNFLHTKVGLGVSSLKDIILKYKLSNVVLEPYIQRPWTDDDTKVIFQREDTFDSTGTIVMENKVDYDEWNKMIPDDFLSNIENGIGIFQWNLDQSKDTFDPLNTADDNSTTLGIYLEKIVPYVYTKTMTPGLGDDVLWFNGVFVDNDDFYADYGEDTSSNAPSVPANAAIYGYVFDDIDNPIVGATVSISEFDYGSQVQCGQTDVNGFYSIVLSAGITSTPQWRDYIYGTPCHLNVSSVGYGETTDIPIGGVRNDFKYDGSNFFRLEIDDAIPDTESQKYKLLRGVDRKSLVFNKFIPMYVNDYRMDRDTSYNLNYNVNIMGDEENPKRTLSVFGDINCENINVYELTATGEIRNIYTKNEIVGEDGISLARDKFNVDSDGHISMDGDINMYGTIKSNGVVTNSLSAGDVNLRMQRVGDDDEFLIQTKRPIVDRRTPFMLNVPENDESIIDGVIETIENENTDIVLKRIHAIDILRGDDLSTDGYRGVEHDNENYQRINTNMATNVYDSHISVSVNKPTKLIQQYPAWSYSDDVQQYVINSYRSAHDADGQCVDTQSSSKTASGEFTFPRGKINTISDAWLMSNSDNNYRNKSMSAVSVYSPDLSVGKVNQSDKIKTYCIYSGHMSQYDKTRDLDSIHIGFNNQLSTIVYTDSRCHHSEWAQMSSDSFIKLDVFANVGGTLYKCEQTDQKTYTFDKCSTDWKGIEFVDKEWSGRSRTYCYTMNPHNITIPVTDTVNKFLKTDESFSLYVIPTGKLYFTSANNTIKGIGITAFRPLSTKRTTPSTTISRNTSKHSSVLNAISASVIPLTYSLTSTMTSSQYDMQSTTICADGISCQRGKYAYGLGYMDGGPVISFKKGIAGQCAGSNHMQLEKIYKMYKWHEQTNNLV